MGCASSNKSGAVPPATSGHGGSVEHLRCSGCGLMQAWPSADETYVCKRCGCSSADVDVIRTMGSGQQVFRRGGLKRKEETDWCEEIEKKLKRLNEIEHLSAGKKSVLLRRRSGTVFDVLESSSLQWACSKCTYSNAECQEFCGVCGHGKQEDEYLAFVGAQCAQSCGELCEPGGREANLEDDSSKDEDVCHICMVNQANVVLLPCAHGGLCRSCLERIVGCKAEASCPQCRGRITGAVEVGASLGDLGVMRGIHILRRTPRQKYEWLCEGSPVD